MLTEDPVHKRKILKNCLVKELSFGIFKKSKQLSRYVTTN
jgi:hypothetical protein